MERTQQEKCSWADASEWREKGFVTTYCEVVKYLRNMTQTDAHIFAVEQCLRTFERNRTMTCTACIHAVWAKMFRSGSFND